MKKILLFGAGKSATCLLDYLSRVVEEQHWYITVADADLSLLQKKLTPSEYVHVLSFDVRHDERRSALIAQADLVISLLPPFLHILIARDCVRLCKHLLTASYADDSIRVLRPGIEANNLLFLCEMGLDPGIDHMSAMLLIDRIRQEGGSIRSFRSHTGGLVAPESDDNPWHYKVSWNPANVVRAGSSGAVYLENRRVREIGYAEIFEDPHMVKVGNHGVWAWYPNRDSLSYIPVYGLESAETFLRTTLRHPAFCEGWNFLVKAGLTRDDDKTGAQIKTFRDWSRPIEPFLNTVNLDRYTRLGLFDDLPLPAAGLSSARILQYLIETRWKMNESDRDMILMLHEIDYELNGTAFFLKSSLMVKGENALRTAMAKTVGLPLGIAARLILEEKINVRGLQIPIIPEIYLPVLEELSKEGILFQEEIS